jgi:NAD(P)-dependent dehydrogenase (short-subunit alcohol dehydrogenase family)
MSSFPGEQPPSHSEHTLSGQVALVTGAGKRIGKAIALELARAGADVAVHVNRSVEEGEDTKAAIEAMGRRAVVVQANQRDVSAIKAACDEAAEKLGTVTLLANSAAIWPHVDIENCSEEDFNLAIEVNLRGPFFWARYLGAAMKKAGGGAIVSIADVTAFRPWADSVPYCISKAGVISMTLGMAKALAPEVRVNAIGPGPIIFPPNYPEEKKREDRDATLRGREGSPEDIARVIRFFFESPNVTGTFLPVDGGYRFGI